MDVGRDTYMRTRTHARVCVCTIVYVNRRILPALTVVVATTAERDSNTSIDNDGNSHNTHTRYHGCYDSSY